jgi:hypothetical protein
MEPEAMKRLAALAVAFAVLGPCVSPGVAGEEAALGVWDVVASTPEGAMPSVMTVTKVDGKLKAEVELNGAKREVSEEAVDGDTLKLKVLYEGVVYALECKITGDAIDGTWEGGGNSGTLKAKRRP